MNRPISITLVIFVLLVGSVSALKISPTQEKIEMDQYETKCTDIWVLPHEDFLISSKWTKEEPGEISNYILTSDEIGLEVDYSYISDGKYEVCFTPNLGGNFYGIIYFYSEKTMIEIGSWIDLNVRELYSIQKISVLTGKAVQEIRESNYDLWFILISLVFIFVFILINLIKKIR